jgi:hypothetical protein
MTERRDNEQWLATEIAKVLDRYNAVIEGSERALPTEQALDIITSVLWLHSCRSGSAASVYAVDSLASALGKSLISTLHQM